MFKKSNGNQPNNHHNKSTTYAFSQPAAVDSPDAIRRAEQATIYQPLPIPTSAPSPVRHHDNPSDPRNPFTDDRDSIRTPSPNASNPLLSHTSPSTRTNGDMATGGYTQRSAGNNGGMPGRGESQTGLLADRQVSQMFFSWDDDPILGFLMVSGVLSTWLLFSPSASSGLSPWSSRDSTVLLDGGGVMRSEQCLQRQGIICMLYKSQHSTLLDLFILSSVISDI